MHKTRHLIDISRILACVTLLFFGKADIVCGQGMERSIRPIAGMEYRAYQINPSSAAGQTIHVVRIDPTRLRLRLVAASQTDGKLRTATEWRRDFHLLIAMNAGMFLKDYSTNVGYLRIGSHVQNGRWNRKYASALAFDPGRPGIPPVIMVDLDEPGSKTKLGNYGSVVQNLRLLKADGQNVWERSDKKWSEAAVAMDRAGQVLFIFCQTPLPTWQFNRIITSLGLDIVRGMHLEGGPLASLSIKAGRTSLDLAGTYELGADMPANISGLQMPIPNVIGVEAR